MPKVKIIEPGEIVTPPTPLPVPSPTFEKEEGDFGTSEAEVITEPRNRYTGDTHAEIPEYEGSYFVTENGTIPCGGYEMISDLVVNVEPKGLTQITITENGTYKPEDYDGYSSVVVAIPTYSGSYSVSANGTLATKDKLMTDDLVVNVQPNLTTLTATENKTYTPTSPVQGFSSVTVNVPVGGNTLKTLLDATKSAYYLFRYYLGNEVANLIQPSDTSEVTTMNGMFYGCSNITSVPLLNTSKVTDMASMFYNCSNLASVPLFDTSNVVGMGSIFRGCNLLSSVPLFDTSKVTSLGYAFVNCRTLTSIPALDASQVTNLGGAFDGCSELREIKMTGMKVSFDIHWSTLFSESALVEILNNLADLTGDTTRTLTMGQTNLDKLTQAEKDIALNKNWTLA